MICARTAAARPGGTGRRPLGCHGMKGRSADTACLPDHSGSVRSGMGGAGGPATSARFDSPTGLAVDRAGNLYIADNGLGRVQKVDGATGVMTTVAGSGVVDAIRNGTPIKLTDFETGVAYMEFTEAVARSARQGEAVQLPLEEFINGEED